MHISEGILSGPVLLGGAILSAVGIGLGLKQINTTDLPKVAILSSGFFVASLIHIPVGPTSAHLLLNGLIGLILGFKAFPAIFVALLFQALLFQFGGLTTLGVNTFNMATPAVLSYYLFRNLLKRKSNTSVFLGGTLGGGLSVLGGVLLTCFALLETEKKFWAVAMTFLTMHLPLAILEALITGFILTYLKKVKPEVLK